MDQDIEASRIGHIVRLALVLLGLVLGFLLLSAVFGAGSASAATRDDPALPGVGPAAALVGDVLDDVVPPETSPAAAITDPVASLADEGVLAVATHVVGPEARDALGTAPIGSLLAPLAGIVDETLADAAASLDAPAPLLAPPADAVPAPPAVTSPAAAAGTAPLGVATGLIDGILAGLHENTAAAVAGAGGPVPAAVLGLGLLALLAARRTPRPDPAIPGSPVFDTDSSPG